MAITPELRKERMAELRKSGIYMPHLTEEQLASPIPPQVILDGLHYAYLYDEPRQRDLDGTYIRLEVLEAAYAKSKGHVDWWLTRRAEREAEAKRAEAEKAAADKAKREQEAVALKAQLRDRYLSMPGTNADQFEAMYPTLLEDHQRREMAERSIAEDRAREAMQAVIRQAIA